MKKATEKRKTGQLVVESAADGAEDHYGKDEQDPAEDCEEPREMPEAASKWYQLTCSCRLGPPEISASASHNCAAEVC